MEWSCKGGKMATRSIIAKKINDKESLAIYCHYDGYLEHNGVILYQEYNTPEKVDKLIGLGDLCVLQRKMDPNPEKAHTRLRPQPGVCIYYGRDMKNPDSEPTITQTSQLANLSNWAEHVYWYDGSEWNHSIMYEDNSLHFKPLKEELELIKPYIELLKQMREEKEPPSLE